jgi:hypothetical protein
VQLDIRTGHAQTVEKVLRWLKEEGGVQNVTVADCGCGTGSLAVPLALEGAVVSASDISAVRPSHSPLYTSKLLRVLELWPWRHSAEIVLDGGCCLIWLETERMNQHTMQREVSTRVPYRTHQPSLVALSCGRLSPAHLVLPRMAVAAAEARRRADATCRRWWGRRRCGITSS